MEKNKALQQMIEDFNKSKTVKDLDRYFREKSMMEILGIDRDENAHSNFLAWLFGNPVTDKEACNLLFELLKKKKAEIIEIEDTINQENRKNLEEQDEFLTDLLHQNPITINVTREDFVCAYYSRDREKPAIHKGEKGDKIIKGRTVIVLTINDVYKIIIENKVCSEEICKWHCLKEEPSEIPVKDELTQNPKQSLWQSQFYFDFYSTSSNSKNVYVFLTLPREKPPVCGSFIHITYQDIMDNLLIPILGKVIDDKTLAIINGYVKALSINYTQDEIMAVNPELVMLYKSLLNENKTLFNKFENRSENTEALIEFWNSYNVLGSMNGYILRPILKAKEMCEHIALLLAYLAFDIAEGKENDVICGVGSAICFMGTLVPMLGIRHESSRISVNLRVLSAAFFLIFVVSHFCFALFGVRMPYYVIVNALILLVFIAVYYGIGKKATSV